MSKPTGGPAFPEIGNVGYKSEWQNESGMTLRDYFAAKAVSALEVPCDYVGVMETQKSYRQWAEKAYQMADAMLIARSK